jgi:DNA-binding phage protein
MNDILLEVNNLIKKVVKIKENKNIKKLVKKSTEINDPRYVAALLGAFMTKKGKSSLIT